MHKLSPIREKRLRRSRFSSVLRPKRSLPSKQAIRCQSVAHVIRGSLLATGTGGLVSSENIRGRATID
ncbi:hypothetical protein E2C01_047789 [Portunus trituberculatus]|uniref:Uncharacterized protein n=1 Tax=Portunus trituberculatus TaxID=210409 RepID=A0A5B7G8U0_PORTR|nr:hypothetical protein [Portunus trituberculatus]